VLCAAAAVVEVELVKASLAKHSLSSSDMPSKIFIAVFSGPHGRRNPQHSIHYNFKHHHALLDDVFKLCVDQRGMLEKSDFVSGPHVPSHPPI
jgi:hypothetical protein